MAQFTGIRPRLPRDFSPVGPRPTHFGGFSCQRNVAEVIVDATEEGHLGATLPTRVVGVAFEDVMSDLRRGAPDVAMWQVLRLVLTRARPRTVS